MNAIFKKRVPATKRDTNFDTVARISGLFIAVSISLAALAANPPITDITTEYVVVEAPNSIGTAPESVGANESVFIVESNAPTIELDELCERVADRKTVVNALESGVKHEDIANVYATCSSPVKPVFKSDEPDAEIEKVSADIGTRAKLALTFTPAIPIGSQVYEKLKICSYHPQRQEFNCVVKQRKRHDFGDPGSFEWVKICVYYPTSGWDIVNTSAVHVHNEPYGVNPPWNYGVVVPADPMLHRQLMAGHTIYARAILSWFYPIPTNNACNPYWWWWWGNVIKFKIKLEP